MRKNGVLTYLHGDHLGSTVLTTNSNGASSGDHHYLGYGRLRTGTEVVTENRFTGQKLDATGLQYFNARYYDPDLGQFLSPDTIIPDPSNLFAYNRYMYTIGNPMRYNDPTGHDWKDVIATVVDFAQGVGAQVGYNNTVVALPSEINSFAPQDGESTSMQVGRFVGNVVTAVQGVAEITGGAGLGGAGIAACSTGVGCVATAPAVIGASAVIAHGATVATIGAVNAGTQLGNAVMAMLGEGDGKPSKSDHAQLRASEGRNTNRAFNDVQSARQGDMFVQENGRYVIRGPNGREHIFEPSGQLVTTVNHRNNSAHLSLVRRGVRSPVTEEQYLKFTEMFK